MKRHHVLILLAVCNLAGLQLILLRLGPVQYLFDRLPLLGIRLFALGMVEVRTKLIRRQRTNRTVLAMHKPPPKVHWHAYWMLSLGTAFVLLATVNAYLVRVRHYSSRIPTGKYGGRERPAGRHLSCSWLDSCLSIRMVRDPKAQRLTQRISHQRTNSPMKYRKLRIVWSVVWGIAAVLLCVLWMRSYWVAVYARHEVDKKPLKSQVFSISSDYGLVNIESRPGIAWPHL